MARILHVLDHSLPLHSGYSFRTRAIMTAQTARGWEVRGLTGLRQTDGGKRAPAAPGDGAEQHEGLIFHRTPGAAPRGPMPLALLGEVRAHAARIVALHREWRFDCLHAHSPCLTGLAAAWAARRLGVPLLYEIRAFWEDAAVGNGTSRAGTMRYRLTRALENHVVARADAIAVICEGLRVDLLRRGVAPGKIMVSPNGVDLTMFGEPCSRDAVLAAELGIGEAGVIGFIGSFYDYEGLDDLIAAMPAVADRGRPVHLLLVGGGPREAALRAQASASSAAARIHFVGRVPHEQVPRYYSLVDIMAYPRKASRLTDLVTPLKPLEAMAQAKLVAASDVGGHRELIEPGVTGTLFRAGDVDDMARALTRLFADRAGWDRLRLNGREFVAEERDWAQNVARYDAVYHRLLALAA